MSKNKIIDELLSKINEQFSPEGAQIPVIKRGSEIEPVRAIPCASPALGYLIGIGGWPEGKLIELFGREHAGKTSVSILFLKDCLEFERAQGGDRIAAFVDVEHRFNAAWAEQLGLKVDEDLLLIQPSDGESATDIMNRLIESNQVCAIVFDSIGAVARKLEHAEFRDRPTMYGGAASVLSRNVKTVGPSANLHKVTVMYLNQLRADMSGYNRPTTPGGHAVKHAMSLRVYLRPGREKYFDKVRDMMSSETQVGFPIVFKTVKNSFGPFGKEAWSDFYNQPNKWWGEVGFDWQRDLQRLALLTGVVEQRGSIYEWEDIRERGRSKFFEIISESGRMEEFRQAVWGTLNENKVVLDFTETGEEKPEAEGPEDVDQDT